MELKKVFEEQYRGWIERNIFERQWVLRDFRKTVGIGAEAYLSALEGFAGKLQRGEFLDPDSCFSTVSKLGAYFRSQLQLLKGFVKDPAKSREFSDTLNRYIHLIDSFSGTGSAE